MSGGVVVEGEVVVSLPSASGVVVLAEGASSMGAAGTTGISVVPAVLSPLSCPLAPPCPLWPPPGVEVLGVGCSVGVSVAVGGAASPVPLEESGA